MALINVLSILFIMVVATAHAGVQTVLLKNVISDPIAVYNDGSPSTYYFRPSIGNSSPNWVIYLEGGWYCFDNDTCAERWETMQSLMTSDGSPSAMNGTGILSVDPVENYEFYTWNAVFVPYCSSDFWGGNATQDKSGTEWAFQGSNIVLAVMEDLMANHGLSHAGQVLFCGGSAGGVGVVVNADRVLDYLTPRVGGLQYFTLVDSGWFMPVGPMTSAMNCSSVFDCPARNGTQFAYDMWNAVPPEACLATGKTWECFFGVHAFATMRSRIMVFQYLYDSAQLQVGGITSIPTGPAELAYADMIRNDLEASVSDQPVPAYFLSSCYYHEILTNPLWMILHVFAQDISETITFWLSYGSPVSFQLWDTCTTPNCNILCPK